MSSNCSCENGKCSCKTNICRCNGNKCNCKKNGVSSFIGERNVKNLNLRGGNNRNNNMVRNFARELGNHGVVLPDVRKLQNTAIMRVRNTRVASLLVNLIAIFGIIFASVKFFKSNTAINMFNTPGKVQLIKYFTNVMIIGIKMANMLASMFPSHYNFVYLTAKSTGFAIAKNLLRDPKKILKNKSTKAVVLLNKSNIVSIGKGAITGAALNVVTGTIVERVTFGGVKKGNEVLGKMYMNATVKTLQTISKGSNKNIRGGLIYSKRISSGLNNTLTGIQDEILKHLAMTIITVLWFFTIRAAKNVNTLRRLSKGNNREPQRINRNRVLKIGSVNNAFSPIKQKPRKSRK